MILSDRDILQRLQAADGLVIAPLSDPAMQVQPASVDLRLSPEFRAFKLTRTTVLDPRDDSALEENTELIDIGPDGVFVLHPGDFVLGCTTEHVELPADLVGRVDGRSSIGRLGVIVHTTAGYIDPGFRGRITLEIANLGKIAVRLYAGMRICQLVLEGMSSPAARPYGSASRQSKYQDSTGPVASRVAQDKVIPS